jgi:hypothetical protein
MNILDRRKEDAIVPSACKGSYESHKNKIKYTTKDIEYTSISMVEKPNKDTQSKEKRK